MQRICFLLKVRKEKLAEYRKAHENVWPEMRAALTKHGWHNYSLFLRDDGTLIGYVETPDFEAAVAGMQKEEVNARWQKEMAAFFEPLKTGAADTSLELVPQIFYLP